MTTLVLRADGGPTIGVGHLARCLAFAEAGVARGWSVVLVGELVGAGWLAERFAAVGVPLRPSTAFAATLDEFAVDRAADVVLVDHYGLGELPEVRARARLVSVEDGHYGRRGADVVVDSGLVVAPRPADGSPVLLAGPRFAPVRGDVVAARHARREPADPPRVVVSMGGSAAADTVAAALTALRDTGLPLSVHAVAAGEVTGPSPAPGQRFTVEPPTPTLPARFAEADLVVSAAGVTVTELCCVGVPAALVQLVDNQAAGYAAALANGLAVGLGTPADLPAAAPTLRALLTDPARRAALAARAAATVDGDGANRVLDAAELTVRAVDRGAVPPAWAAPGPLADQEPLALVVERRGEPVGVVRFARVAGSTWETSVTVAPGHRGAGLGARVLLTGEGALAARTPVGAVLARVPEADLAALALFRRAGYAPTDRPDDGPVVWLRRPAGG